MSSPPGYTLSNLLTSGLHAYSWMSSKLFEAASATLLVYELFLTLSDEIKYVWPHRRGLPKVLFILSRYVIPVMELTGSGYVNGSRRTGKTDVVDIDGHVLHLCLSEVIPPASATSSTPACVLRHPIYIGFTSGAWLEVWLKNLKNAN
ncbi:hypothetical protein R3P38DRAFT_2790643 [Favolaschia claudopus]|uniref:DUF6533 domain-containing protein n=1 Tax=Favolaschia claudopus TaxID=2862362 RepID=A0AAW0AK36_9AGAR